MVLLDGNGPSGRLDGSVNSTGKLWISIVYLITKKS
jgi:hypothetical protein